MNKKQYLAIEPWDDLYNGAGIYALVDENGRKYIGQARHIQNRLHMHRVLLNKYAQHKEPMMWENANISKHAWSGGKFRVEILLKIPPHKATVNCLRYYENYFYNNCDNPYNAAPPPAPNWGYTPCEIPLD